MADDLFSFRYPESPGFKEATTSRDAAAKVAPTARTLRDQVMMVLTVALPGGLTADEAAAKLGRSEFSIRPRLSELRKMDLITATEQRRPNASGLNAIVWRATPKET